MNETLRIIIVGGTGYLGQQLGLKLTQAGHQVSITTRNPEQWIYRTAFPCQVIHWDPSSEDFPLPKKNTPHVVINLAGAGIGDQRWTTAYKNTLRDSRLVTTRKIARAIKNHNLSLCHDGQVTGGKPVHLVQASAIGYYGSRGDDALTETTSQGQGFLAQLCADWEQEALQAKTESNRVVLVRIGVVLGHGSGFLKTMTPLYMRGAGALIDGGRPWFPWIHVDDVVSVFAEAVTNSQWNGIVNATAPEPAQMGDFHKLMTECYGGQLAPPVPPWLIKTLLGQQSEIALGSHKVMSEVLRHKDFKFRYRTLPEAFKALYETDVDRGSYHVVSQQWFPHHKRELWKFFATESNLETLTPPWLSFKVLSKSTPEIESGTILKYQLKLHGIPIQWETHISQWQPAHKFIDVQAKGPYAMWHHTHSFQDHAGGTLMTDHVRLRLPLGKLGFLVASPMVVKDVERIFSFRKQKIAEIFGTTPHIQLVSEPNVRS